MSQVRWTFTKDRILSWVSFQNATLFDATLSVSRAPWCLSRSYTPRNDHLVLRNQSTTITNLRRRLSSDDVANEIDLVYTVGRMVTLAISENAVPSHKGLHD